MCVHRLACRRECTPLKMFTTIIILSQYSGTQPQNTTCKLYYSVVPENVHIPPTEGIGNSQRWGGVRKGQKNVCMKRNWNFQRGMWRVVSINPFCMGGIYILWHYISSHFNRFFWGIDTQVPYHWDLGPIFQEWNSRSVSKRIVSLVTMLEVHWATHSAPLQSKKILQIHVHESSEGKVPHLAVQPQSHYLTELE